jgi:esterase/lipase superfamily enzyme
MRALATNADPLTSDTSGKTSYYLSWDNVPTWTPFSVADWKVHIEAGDRPVLYFVHGFNNGLVKAQETADKLQASVPSHQVVLVHWANRADVIDYEHDRSMARTAAPFCAEALSVFPASSVVTHSMGNYVIQLSDKLGMIGKLCMVAADVDDNVFPPCESGMIFYCELDGALSASMDVHLRRRLGQFGGVNLPANFQQINFTQELLLPIDPLAKHSAYFDKPKFYALLNQFLQSAQAAGAPK